MCFILTIRARGLFEPFILIFDTVVVLLFVGSLIDALQQLEFFGSWSII